MPEFADLLDVVGDAVISTIVLAVVASSFFLWLTAKTLRLEKSGFVRAIIAALAATLMGWLVVALLCSVPISLIWGCIAAFVLALALLQIIFRGPAIATFALCAVYAAVQFLAVTAILVAIGGLAELLGA